MQDAFPGSSSLSPRTLRSGSRRSGLESNFSANENYGSTYSSTSIEDFYTSAIHATDDSTDEEDYKELWVRNFLITLIFSSHSYLSYMYKYLNL